VRSGMRLSFGDWGPPKAVSNRAVTTTDVTPYFTSLILGLEALPERPSPRS